MDEIGKCSCFFFSTWKSWSGRSVERRGQEISRVSPKLEGDVDTSSARESKSIAGRKDRVGNGTRARFTRKSGNRGSGARSLNLLSRSVRAGDA